MKMARKPDRRADPRWQVVFGIDAQLDGARVTLIDISEGGFVVRTRAAVTVGDCKPVQFRAPNSPGDGLTVHARVVHVNIVEWEPDEESVMVGFAFDAGEPQERRAELLRLVDGTRLQASDGE